MTTETLSLPGQAAPDAPVVAAENGAASPLSVQESHTRLSLAATKLTEEVRRAKEQSDLAAKVYRSLRDELEQTTRLLKAYERVRSPKRRKQ